MVAPSKYLGVNFKLRGGRVANVQYLVEKLNSKLQGWKAKLLSQVGRITLISSMLQSMPLYTLSYFKVPETICDKLDAITWNDVWWGHDPRARKLHLINWNDVCKPKSEGGVGLKRFKLMNQAMLGKQFWRIAHNPQSLLAKTLKGKYFPRGSIHDCSPKPHNSWIWRNIIKTENVKLKEGKWWIGRGTDISITHKDWFPQLTNSPDCHNFETTLRIVADLINQSTSTWKLDLIRSSYVHHMCKEVLSYPISKTGSFNDKLLGSIHPLESSKSTRHTPCYKETFKLPVLTQGPMPLFLRMFGDLFGELNFL